MSRSLSILIVATQEGMIRVFLSLAVVLSIYSCGHPIQHAHAEITDIKYHSDTSVVVSIEVLRNSNAESSCKFLLYVDSIPVTGYYGVDIYPVSNSCNLKKNYEVTVGGLKKEIPYYFQLYTFGSFDMGGPGGGSDKLTGKQWEYTIP